MRLTRLGAAVLGACLAAACADLNVGVSDGVFTSVGSEFSVAVPPIPGIHSRAGTMVTTPYVDFALGEGDWSAAGGYSVEWVTPPAQFASDADFYAFAQDFIPRQSKDYADGYFTPVQSGRSQNGGRPAWQVVSHGGKDGVEAYWVATAVDFGTRVGVVMLLVPVKSARHDGPADPQQALVWGDYPAFLASLKPGN